MKKIHLEGSQMKMTFKTETFFMMEEIKEDFYFEGKYSIFFREEEF